MTVGLPQAGASRPEPATLVARAATVPDNRAHVRSDEPIQRAVRAMDSVSRALVRAGEGPRGLLEEVVRAAAEHLSAQWTLLALADGRLVGARPRVLVADRTGAICSADAELPAVVRRELGAIRAGHAVRRRDDDRWVRVPLTLQGEHVGSLAGLHGLAADPESGDLSVLRILANQAAVSLHTSVQYQAGLTLHRRARLLYDEAQARARDLEERTVELRRLERLLAGTAVVVARDEAESHGPQGDPIRRRLTAREREVLSLLARGLSNKEIGAQLWVSETTAKFHVGNILRKLGVSRRAEAVYEASKLGMI